ncbi:MAG: CoA transferase [Burkholderiales bacterium]|nr:CoA transferase [Burkholderiales bacterium]
MSAPFQDVTVLSLAEQLPGPYATLLMADLGADVILVERPGIGDPARAFPDFFASVSRNKRSVCLNLKHAEDKSAFLELVARADVVLEGYAPGTAARLGVDYESLRKVKPDLVYASISGFGQTGPYRSRPAHDISYQAIAGVLADQAKHPGKTPELPLGDMSAAMYAAWAIAAALFARERTGNGTFIDVSVADGLVSWMSTLLVPVMNGGSIVNVTESPGYGNFACADGGVLSLSIAHEDHFWRALCGVLALQDVAALGHAQRVEAAHTLRPRVMEGIREKPLAYWASVLDQHGVPWSPVHALEQVARDPHFQVRGLFAHVVAADGKPQMHIRQPVHFSAYPPLPLTRVPALGEHNTDLVGRKAS